MPGLPRRSGVTVLILAWDLDPTADRMISVLGEHGTEVIRVDQARTDWLEDCAQRPARRPLRPYNSQSSRYRPCLHPPGTHLGTPVPTHTPGAD